MDTIARLTRKAEQATKHYDAGLAYLVATGIGNAEVDRRWDAMVEAHKALAAATPKAPKAEAPAADSAALIAAVLAL